MTEKGPTLFPIQLFGMSSEWTLKYKHTLFKHELRMRTLTRNVRIFLLILLGYSEEYHLLVNA